MYSCKFLSVLKLFFESLVAFLAQNLCVLVVIGNRTEDICSLILLIFLAFQFLLCFIESMVASFEPRIEGESTSDFDLRRQELTSELRASFQNFARKDAWGQGVEPHLIESYRAGDTLVRT